MKMERPLVIDTRIHGYALLESERGETIRTRHPNTTTEAVGKLIGVLAPVHKDVPQSPDSVGIVRSILFGVTNDAHRYEKEASCRFT